MSLLPLTLLGGDSRSSRAAWRPCSRRWAWASAARACRASCPAASCSASRSRARSSTAAAWCSPTSPPATSTRTAPDQVLRAAARADQGQRRRGHPRHALAPRGGDRRSHPAARRHRGCESRSRLDAAHRAMSAVRVSPRARSSPAARWRTTGRAARSRCSPSPWASRSVTRCSSSPNRRSTSSPLGAQLLAGDADLQMRGPRRGFDEALYPELARLPEVAVASPVRRSRCPACRSRRRAARSSARTSFARPR